MSTAFAVITTLLIVLGSLTVGFFIGAWHSWQWKAAAKRWRFMTETYERTSR